MNKTTFAIAALWVSLFLFVHPFLATDHCPRKNTPEVANAVSDPLQDIEKKQQLVFDLCPVPQIGIPAPAPILRSSETRDVVFASTSTAPARASPAVSSPYHYSVA